MSIFEGLFRSYLQDTTCYELEEGVASGGTTFFLPDCCEVWTGATVKVVMRRIILSVISVVLLSGCSPYQVREFSTPSIEPPVHFSEKFDQPLLNLEGRKTAPYWTQYGAPKLETLVSAAFENNFSLSEVIARIEQVRAQAQVAGAGRFPQLTVEGTGRRTRVETRTPIFAGGFTPATQIIQNQFAVSNGLSYELDLWERVASTNRAALLRVRATETELESSALSLSGEVFRQWMTALEAVQLERVLEEQIETSKTFLELTELRFSLSQGTALDVFDQRQQLASLRTQLPRVEMSRDQALHRLAVLTGQAPGAVTLEAVGDFFHVVPEWIPDVRPADLIVLRPDLRSILFQLQASEYDVAAAVADRFPRLTVGFQYNFTTPDLDSLFPNKTL
ncbi:MAG: TolC family protein, partial [Bdellovibrionales bacterium]|nr:TolC family protein [Bdellovibrionales bacterium]